VFIVDQGPETLLGVSVISPEERGDHRGAVLLGRRQLAATRPQRSAVPVSGPAVLAIAFEAHVQNPAHPPGGPGLPAKQFHLMECQAGRVAGVLAGD